MPTLLRRIWRTHIRNMRDKNKNVELKLNGNMPMDIVRDIEEHRNVTVIVSQSLVTNEITLGWIRQENTEDIYYDNQN